MMSIIGLSVQMAVNIMMTSSHLDSIESDDDDDESPKGKITAILNKINRFVFEIHKEDILLIPSKNSDHMQHEISRKIKEVPILSTPFTADNRI